MSGVALGFGLLHPAIFLAGMAACALPVLIHAWARRHPKRVRWAAMTLLRGASEQARRGVRVQHWLLMSTRVSLCLLAAFAAARPFVGGASGLSARHHTVLLDDSFSMRERLGDAGTAFDRAREVAAEFARSADAKDTWSLITLGGVAGSGNHKICTRDEFLTQLAAVKPVACGPDLAGALRTAAELAATSTSPPSNRQVILLTNQKLALAEERERWRVGESEPRAHLSRRSRQAKGEASGAERQKTDGETERQSDGEKAVKNRQAKTGNWKLATGNAMTIAAVRPEQADNVAITSFSPADRLLAPGLPAMLRAEVSNCGSAPFEGGSVELLVDGQVTRTAPLPRIEAGGRHELMLEHRFARAGQYRLQARLRGGRPDVLPDDDTRPLAVEVPERMRVLIIAPAPRESEPSRGPVFLQAALQPQRRLEVGGIEDGETERQRDGENDKEVSPFTTRLLRPELLANEPLNELDWLILQDVPRLPAEEWRRLYGFVEGGGGLLIFCGPRVDAHDYSRFGPGVGPLPAQITDVVQLDPHSGTTFRNESASSLAELAENPRTGFFQARTSAYLRTAAVESPECRVLLRYETGDPALIAGRIGEGRVLLCTTSADMAWTNLPALGDYVSFVLAAAQYLCPDRVSWRNADAGEPIRADLAPGHDARVQRAAFISGGETDSAAAGSEAVSGFFEVPVGENRQLFARQIPAWQSDLRPADEKRIGELGAPATVQDITRKPLEVESQQPVTELDALVWATVLLLLLAESWLASRGGSIFHGRGVRDEGRGGTTETQKRKNAKRTPAHSLELTAYSSNGRRA